MIIFVSKTRVIIIELVIGVLALTGCGVKSGDSRPSSATLLTGINLLINTFDSKHPSLITWNISDVKKQIAGNLPEGTNTDAGWLLQWPHANKGELSRVIIPWGLIGQYPNNPQPMGYRYNDGTLVPQSTIDDLKKVFYTQETQGDEFFAAVVNVRESKVDPHWIIFSTEPYLPVTDPAYGFATVINKQWVIADFGTALVGCTKVPMNVESEFGFTCP
jgi:hypothetical protein